ncbi:unnamed protein product [Polarella glacialis]|uniref:Cytochrome P450 n=1 Tax=Polarella glacialis TaxID=89957 RepID=A0A813HGW5_POLGL|nr:unnamed protein product [Polarella glacialis]
MDTASLQQKIKVAVPTIILCWWVLRRARQSRLPRPPSPPGHWLLGHALQLPDPSGPDAPHVDVLLLEWARKYNWTVFSFWVPIVGCFIVAADPALVRQALVIENYPKSPTYGSLLPLLGEGSMLVAEGSEWAAKRRVFNPGFSPGFLREVVAAVAEKVQTLYEKCSQAADSAEELGLHKATVDFTADVIAQVAFGEDWGTRGGRADAPSAAVAPTRQLMFELQYECTQNQIIPWRIYTNLRSRLRIWRLQRLLDADMVAVVHRRIAALSEEDGTSAPSGRKDILSLALKQTHLDSSSGTLGSAEVSDVVAQMKTFFFAGHDTTSTMISWAIWLLAMHPKVCEEVRAEVAKVLGPWGSDSSGLGMALPPTYEAFQECEYLEAVLQETLRLYPPAGSARYVSDPNATFAGMTIGNSILYVSHYVLHRHPALWDEPDEFRPERFLKGLATSEKRNAAFDPFAFGPFSRGPRDCIGKYFAMLEGKIAVAALVRAFDFSAVHPDETIAYRVTQRPQKGARMRVRHRPQ